MVSLHIVLTTSRFVAPSSRICLSIPCSSGSSVRLLSSPTHAWLPGCRRTYLLFLHYSSTAKYGRRADSSANAHTTVPHCHAHNTHRLHRPPQHSTSSLSRPATSLPRPGVGHRTSCHSLIAPSIASSPPQCSRHTPLHSAHRSAPSLHTIAHRPIVRLNVPLPFTAPTSSQHLTA